LLLHAVITEPHERHHSDAADNDDDMSSSSTSSKAVDVIDLEDLIKRWAAQMFDYTKNKEQARIPKEHLVFNVDWRRVRFVHHDPEFVDQTKPPAPKSQVLYYIVNYALFQLTTTYYEHLSIN